MTRNKFKLLLIGVVIFMSGCATQYSTNVTFPSPDQLFITTGDGDIQKPYTPVGQIFYYKKGPRIGLPLLGLIRFDDVDPAYEISTNVARQARAMGGNAIINLRVVWEPPSNGFLGIAANGGRIVIYGTVISM
ncbi:hypothetical protein CYPRO_0678 [Cyclonatronum proteinivorum]|uniref:Heavy-metal-binding n=1 Tax=Cyclonatronum proteinivorum TaxID=1457365 RepID=A0A345UHL0_9BACT|nr:hypothetical protein [Cyclonatronum proteinivorum]AXI99961.1 hypothetical protein CYPRO_0678 [Cyclonatronum proteinivorum]